MQNSQGKCVKNTLNYDYQKQKGEVNPFPSLTVPDQALSIKEILRRFAAGIPMDAGKMPIFQQDQEDEEGMPDFRHMDLVDRQEAAIQYAEELAEIEQRIKASKAAKAPLKRAKDLSVAASTPEGVDTQGG